LGLSFCIEFVFASMLGLADGPSSVGGTHGMRKTISRADSANHLALLTGIALVLSTLIAVGCDETPRLSDGGLPSSDGAHDGLEGDGSEGDGPTRDGVGVDGQARDGQARDGQARDGLAVDGGKADSSSQPVLIGPRPVVATPLAQGTLFASPTGSGDSCTKAAPCDLWKATDKAQAGDVVFLRGGIYAITKNVYFRGRGTTGKTHFESYPGELAVLDGAGLTPSDDVYIRVVGDPVILRRLEVTRMTRAGISIRSSDNLLEGVRAHHNLLSGIHIHESYTTPVSNRNVLRDCIAHDNSGAGLTNARYADGGNSDGISISSGLQNRVEHCAVYRNSDDGFDSWRSQETYVGYSVAYENGIAAGNGQGFKAGGQPPSRETTVEHCLSYQNKAAGFDYNSGKNVVFRFNTSYKNKRAYYFGSDTTASKNIQSANNDPQNGKGTQTDNAWQRGGSVTFISTDPTHADFLRPTVGGGFEDIGAYGGL
jgi:hypothetical protein